MTSLVYNLTTSQVLCPTSWTSEYFLGFLQHFGDENLLVSD